MLNPAPEPTPVALPGPGPGTRDDDTRASPAAEEGPRRPLPVERLGAAIEVLLCSGIPTQLLVFGALAGFGMPAQTPDGAWSPRFVVTMSLIDMVLVIGLVYVFLRAHGESVHGFLVGSRRPAREVLVGLALIPAAFILVVLVLGAILAVRPELHNVPVNPFEGMMQTPADAALFAVVATLAGGVREEVQRAFIIRRFDRYLGGAVAGIFLYSTVFGLGHLKQGYAVAIATGTLGAAWGFTYWARRSVIAPMVSHAGFNLAQLFKYLALAS